MNILEFFAFLLFFGGLIFVLCYCFRYETKRQKRFETRQERLVVALEGLRDSFFRS